jgi:transcriptional regulator with XRE-family HTH domain
MNSAPDQGLMFDRLHADSSMELGVSHSSSTAFSTAELRSADLRSAKHRGSARRAALRSAINTHIGSRIRTLRLGSGKTQAELGAALGLTNQQVQKYEKGANGMNLDKVWCTADYFGVDVAYFIEGLSEAVAQHANGDDTRSGEQAEHRRLRLALADALHRTRSPKLLRSMLQLLRAAGVTDETEDERAEAVGADQDYD